MKNNDIATKIIILRENKGWSQVELSKKSGVSNATISDIESGKKNPKMSTLQKIAYAFGMDIIEMLSYIPNSNGNVVSQIIDIENRDILEWLRNPANLPYIKFVYNLSKEVPINMLEKLKFFLDVNAIQKTED